MCGRILICLLFFLFPLLATAQVKIYQHDTTVKVYAYGREQTLAFSGGFNNPQFTMGDLNHDGLPDLVVYEPGNSVRTFINEGSAGHPNYRYAPEYALRFPPAIDYLILEDYNCDGVPDLFDQGMTGFEVYKGYYNSLNQLCFVYYKSLFYTNDPATHGPANAFNNPGDIPAIVDVDNDGDLDFVAYDINGGVMNLYKNMRVEEGLPCDSIDIKLKDMCWGKVYQGYDRTHTLNYSCDNSRLLRTTSGAARKTHSGNTPCLFDWDMDGDYDYLDGNISFNEITFLKNGRIENASKDSMVYQDTLWQVGGTQVHLATFPAAFNVDIDQDGKKDILVSPNGRGAENYKCVWFYKNFSNPGSPDWRFQSDSFLTDMTIDLGSAAYPSFFDFDKDGKPDLFVGSEGYYQPGGTFKSRISYYKNTTTAGAPAFTLQTTDFLNLSSFAFGGTAPAFGDIDGDGVSDLIIGHTDGTLSYFKNTAAWDSVAPNFTLQQLTLTDMTGATINVGGRAAPFIYDIDKDGMKDLIIGGSNGYIQYYQNVATTPGTIKLKLVNMRLGHVKVDSTHFSSCNAVPFIGKIDSSGIEYLLVGSNSGNVYQYTGFQTGDTTARYTLLDAHYAFIDSMYSVFNNPSYGVYDGLRSAIAVGDIANDGNYYLLAGNNKGGLESYRLKAYVPVIDHTGVNTVGDGKVEVYPNPANQVLNIKWDSMQQPQVQISFINMTGQILFTTSRPSAAGQATVPISELPNGAYICLLKSGSNRYYSKFTIVR